MDRQTGRMQSYDDVQTLDQVAIEDADSVAHMFSEPSGLAEGAELWEARAYNQTPIKVLWCPNEGRAGIVWGADADWTDAESVRDALERYFGDSDKEMID